MSLRRDLRKVYLRAAEVVLDPPTRYCGYACNAITGVIYPQNYHYRDYCIQSPDARRLRVAHQKFGKYFGKHTAYWWGTDQTPKSQHERALALCLMAEIIKTEDLRKP